MDIEQKLSNVKEILIAQKYPYDMIDDAIQSACLQALIKGLNMDALTPQWFYVVAKNILLNTLKRDSRNSPPIECCEEDMMLVVDIMLDSMAQNAKIADGCRELLHPGEGTS